jgi:hypothetical protein
MFAMKKALFFSMILLLSSNFLNAQKMEKKVLRHVVMFGWDKGVDSNDVNKVVNAFRALLAKIKLIKAFEWGTNNSPENLNKGLTHCFTLSFYSEADRDAYLIHPDHKAFVAALKPSPTAVTVFDYWAK